MTDDVCGWRMACGWRLVQRIVALVVVTRFPAPDTMNTGRCTWGLLGRLDFVRVDTAC